jgi:drug/metabolite transporter (DMT)-like permease
MLCGSLSFALMGALTHALGKACDWQVIALTRTALALLFTAGLAWAAGARLVVRGPRSLWMRSLAGSVSLLCSFFALTRLPVSDVLTLTNMFPIWVALLSWPLLGEVPGPRVWISAACGVAGVVLIQQPHLADGNFAALIALLCSFSTALAMIGLNRLQTIDVRAIVAHFSGVSLLFCFGALLVGPRGTVSTDVVEGPILLALLAVGVTATVGQLFLTKAFASGPAAQVSIVGLTQIVFAMLLDRVVWERTFNAETLAGIALVVLPTAWIMGSSSRYTGYKRGPSAPPASARHRCHLAAEQTPSPRR